MVRKCLPLAALAMLSGCASIVSGTSQEITITSSPPGADCVVSRQGMMLQQVTTPASPTVQRNRHDLSVACSKSGYVTATQFNNSGVEPWLFGNIFIGGLVGLMIDFSTGAESRYDNAMAFNLPHVPHLAPVAADLPGYKQPAT